MLTKRIIPCLDVHDGRVVKCIKFVDLKDAGDPVESAIVYNEAGADELVFLDITASAHGRKPILEVISKTAEKVFIPLTVGGGINTVEDYREILKAGADKISICSPALRNPVLISQAAERFGSQCVVVAIDAKRRQDGSGWDAYLNGGRVNTGRDAVEWAAYAQKMGCGEILLTSMDRDGTRIGYDLELLKAVNEVVSIPVIASGGAGTLGHFEEGVTIGGADALLAASLFHYNEMTIDQVKDYLSQKGIPVRKRGN